MHAEDAANWAYPDCTPEFLGAMACAIYIGTYQKVRLVTPFVQAMKVAIVQEGLLLGVPYSLTRSCYAETVVSCGKCPTCLSRLAAFESNDEEDPIPYEFDNELNTLDV
jgi:7-cyano-7-deazaguanine synthase